MNMGCLIDDLEVAGPKPRLSRAWSEFMHVLCVCVCVRLCFFHGFFCANNPSLLPGPLFSSAPHSKLSRLLGYCIGTASCTSLPNMHWLQRSSGCQLHPGGFAGCLECASGQDALGADAKRGEKKLRAKLAGPGFRKTSTL